MVSAHGSGVSQASVTLPIVSENSFDVPVLDGTGTTPADGAPVNANQGDETKATFLCSW